jgi:hypothetical protein
MFKAIVNRIHVFMFGIGIAVMGLWDPIKTLHAVNDVLNRQDMIDDEIDRLHK